MGLESKHIKITYLYDEKDKDVCEMLQNRLAGLKRAGLIEEIPVPSAGSNRLEKMKLCLDAAEVIILFISHHFDNNKDFNSHEIITHIKNCEARGAHIWPIWYKSILWKYSPYQIYEVFFGEDKSIYENTEIGYRKCAEKADKAFNRILAQKWVHTGDEYYVQMQLEEACEAYKLSLQCVANHLPALFGMVRICCKQGKREQAETFFAQFSPPSRKQGEKSDLLTYVTQEEIASFYYYRGRALLELGQLLEAIHDFQQVYKQLIHSNETAKRICAEASCSEGDAFFQLSYEEASISKTYLDEALRAYQRAKDLDPDNLAYWMRIGNIYCTLGKHLSHVYYKQAQEMYQQIIDRNPSFASAYVGKGNVFSRLNSFNEAITAYDFALDIDQHQVQAHNGKGWVLLAMDQPQQALQSFDQAISLEPSNPRYYHGKGRAMALLGYYQEALTAYTKARECGLVSKDLMIDRALILINLGENENSNGTYMQADLYFKEAREIYYKVLIEDDYAHPEAIHYGLGRLAAASEDWKNALHFYQDAISLAPYKADAYLELGKTLVKMGKYKEALDNLKKASSSYDHPESMILKTDVDIAYGDAYRRMAEIAGPEEHFSYQKEARKYYERAIEDGGDASAYLGLAKTYVALHSNRKAIDLLDAALQQNSQFGECYFIKGKCHYALKEFSVAHALYREAIKHGFCSIPLQNALGDVLLELGEYEPALKIFETVITETNEKSAYAFCGKGMALQKLGMNNDSLNAFDTASVLDAVICIESRYSLVLQDIFVFFERRLSINDHETSLYVQKGMVLSLSKKEKDALEAYTLAIKYGHASAFVYYRRGNIYERLGNYSKALKDYNEAMRREPLCEKAQASKDGIEKYREGFLKRFTSLLKN
jgi:tetratricopeptide (TPR) repeat protein